MFYMQCLFLVTLAMGYTAIGNMYSIAANVVMSPPLSLHNGGCGTHIFAS